MRKISLECLGLDCDSFWGKDILKKTDECVKVIEETIFELEMEEVTFEEE